MQTGLRRIWRVLRPLLVAYLLVVLLMTMLETRLVYPAPRADVGEWNPRGLGHQDVTFASSDGTQLHGWLLEHPSPRHVILYCHGNGEHVAFNGQLMAELRDDLSATVLIFDYRGYGKSEGRPHEAGVVADGVAAQKWLADRAGIKPSEVVLMGRSLGGGVAIAAAEQLGARGLILQSTFARMVDTAAVHFPWLPVRLVMRNRYDSIGRIAGYQGPVIQSHGTADEVIPYTEGKRLFEAIPSSNKRWIDVPAGRHCCVQPPEYDRSLREFLDSLPEISIQPEVAAASE